MTNQIPLAKGTAFLHDREFVIKAYGPDAWQAVVAVMAPVDVETLESIVAIGWYENALLFRVLAATEEALRERDPKIIDTLGRYAAEGDLKRIHRVFLRMANPAVVVEKATAIWGRFFDTGTWRVRRVDRGADASLVGAGVVHDVFCRNLRAYLHRLFELVGAKDVTVRHVACRTRGDAECEYAIRWK